MSDDYEEKGSADWYYPNKACAIPDERRRLARQNGVTCTAAEVASPEREVKQSERARELQDWIDGFLLSREHALNSIDSISAYLVPSRHKAEWHEELDRVDPRDAEAKVQLENLLAKVRTLKSAAIEGEKWVIHMESQPFPDSQRDEKLKRKIDEIRLSCLKSGLEVIESSLKLLVCLCESAQIAKPLA